jgi:hypothetical protein
VRVTILVRHAVRPGLEPLFVAAVVRRMQAHRLGINSLRPATLLQSHEQPQQFCWLGQWQSPEEYEARAEEMRADFAPYCTSPPRPYFLTHLHVREHIGEPLTAVTCGLIQATPAGADAVRTMVREQTTIPIESTPDLALRALYQDAEEPERFVAIRGWRTTAGAEAFLRASLGAIRAQLAESGARLELFSGRVWVDADRQALPTLRLAAD